MKILTSTGSSQGNLLIPVDELCSEVGHQNIMKNTTEQCNPTTKTQVASEELKQPKLEPLVDHLKEKTTRNCESGSSSERTVKSPVTVRTV